MWFIELGTICVTVAVVVRVWWLVVQVLSLIHISEPTRP